MPSKNMIVVDDDDEDDDDVAVKTIDDDDEVEIVKETKKKVASAPAKKKSKLVVEEEDEDVVKGKKVVKKTVEKKKKTTKKIVEDDDDEEEEEDDDSKKKKKSQKKTVTKTRKGTNIEFISEDGASAPKTKKEAAAAKKAAKAAEGFSIASGDPSNPVRNVDSEDPIAVKYSAMTVAQLKDWLRANDQLLSGVKDALVPRCIDGEINGRIPKCQRCKKGKISFNVEKGIYFCSGYFDDDANMMIRCPYREASIERLSWVDPENAASATVSESVQETKAEAADIPEDFITSVNAMPAKDAADAVGKFAKDFLQLSLSDDEKKVRLIVGPMLMANRNEENKFDVRKVLALLTAVYPKKVAASSAGGGEADQGNASKVPANEAIATLLEELAKYEKKKGGENVGFKIAALKKAALAIRGLDYEIKDGNAMGKSGKTKVEGIGKGTAKTIQDFLDSGKTSSPYLDKLKAEVGE